MLSHSGCACITLWTRRHRCSDSHSGFYSCCGYGHGRGAITRDCRRLFRFSLKRKGGRKKRKTPTIKHGSVTKWVYRTACVDLRQTAAVVRGVQGTYGQLVGVETNQSCNNIGFDKNAESIRVEHPVVRILIYHYAASTATVAFYRGGWRNRAARRGLREDTRGNRRMRRKVVLVLSAPAGTHSLAGRAHKHACVLRKAELRTRRAHAVRFSSFQYANFFLFLSMMTFTLRVNTTTTFQRTQTAIDDT